MARSRRAPADSGEDAFSLKGAGLQPGRTARIAAWILGAVALGLLIWSQIPWSGTIVSKESEWKITLSADRHTAGDVTFDLSNRGTIAHEFLVVRSDKTAKELLADVDPTTNRIDEDLLYVIGEQPEYAAGTTAELTLPLPAGHYVVMCNIEGHYKAGMYADLTIAPAAGESITPAPTPTPPAPATGAVDGVEKEWAISLSDDTHVSGLITFNLANEGTIAHEFLVVRSAKSATDLVADVDPTTGRIDEALLDVIDEQPEYDPGAPGQVTVDLTPGHYVVMCNIAGHYKAGMYADFEVVAAVASEGAISGVEQEWSIELDSHAAKAGSVTFNLANNGTIAHEFLVVRSGKTAYQLLADVDAATSRIDEALLDVIGEQPEYEPGTPGSVTLDLTPGHYVVMCNIAAHYKAGMYADFYVLD